MRGVFSNEQSIRNKAIQGVVPGRSAVRNQEGLSKGGVSENIIQVSVRKRRRDIRCRYTSNCTRRVVRKMAMWVQELVTMARGEISTLTCVRSGPCGGS